MKQELPNRRLNQFETYLSGFGNLLLPVSLVYFGVLLLVRVVIYANADGIHLGDGNFVGGDFLAFWTATKAFLSGNALEMYDREAFELALSKVSGLDQHHLMWQYPPTVYFLLIPIGLLNYIPAFVLWMVATFLLLAAVLRKIGLSWREVAIIVGAPGSILVMDTGQISFLTTALFVGAVFFAGTRPILAGVLAGLLTIKPQLGLLIPIAFIAAGCWRAFSVAAIVALLMSVAATLSFGIDGWVTFYDSVTRIYDDYTADYGSTPPLHMTTFMSQFLLLGVSEQVASVLHMLMSLIIVMIVAKIWRWGGASVSSAGVICAGALLITPYAYSYELVLLSGTAGAIILSANKSGWLSGERAALLLGWGAIATFRMLPTSDFIQGPFCIVMLAFVVSVRRAMQTSRVNLQHHSSRDVAELVSPFSGWKVTAH